MVRAPSKRQVFCWLNYEIYIIRSCRMNAMIYIPGRCTAERQMKRYRCHRPESISCLPQPYRKASDYYTFEIVSLGFVGACERTRLGCQHLVGLVFLTTLHTSRKGNAARSGDMNIYARLNLIRRGSRQFEFDGALFVLLSLEPPHRVQPHQGIPLPV
jgi:hypothetical protein